MRLPKLKLNKGRYLGMLGGNENYDCAYYSANDVELYKKAAKALLKKYNKLKIQLKEQQLKEQH